MLLSLNGLRVNEACSADMENLGFERGHRILRIVGKGNKPAVIPLMSRTARTIDLAIGERMTGSILLRHDGSRVDRRMAHRWVRSVAKRAGIGQVHPQHVAGRGHHVRLEAGVPLREAPIAAGTPTPARPLSMTTAARASTATPPTSWSPSSPAADLGTSSCYGGVSWDAAILPVS